MWWYTTVFSLFEFYSRYGSHLEFCYYCCRSILLAPSLSICVCVSSVSWSKKFTWISWVLWRVKWNTEKLTVKRNRNLYPVSLLFLRYTHYGVFYPSNISAIQFQLSSSRCVGAFCLLFSFSPCLSVFLFSVVIINARVRLCVLYGIIDMHAYDIPTTRRIISCVHSWHLLSFISLVCVRESVSGCWLCWPCVFFI